MRKQRQRDLRIGVCLSAAFVLWTLLVSFVDVAAIGPKNSQIGFSAMNGFIHRMIGVHLPLYVITDWLSLIPLGFVMGFALLGLVQWVKRKNILKVDFGILALGGFYLVLFAVYLLFETVVINYRPVLIGGVLEASYPSSTTVLVICVMQTAAMQLKARIRRPVFNRCVQFSMKAFILFMVIGRLLSGVHWLSDIIGGILLSLGFVTLYRCICPGENGRR